MTVISLNSPILLFCLLFGSLIAVITQQVGQQVNLPRVSASQTLLTRGLD